MSVHEALFEAIRSRTPIEANSTIGYLTYGDTYIVASPSRLNDDNRPHDLVAVTTTGDVIGLRTTVNPGFIELIREALNG